MMKRTHKQCQTPPSVTVQVKPNTLCSRQVRRRLWMKTQEAEGPPKKSQRNKQWIEMYNPQIMPPTFVISRQEMTAFFILFDDDLVHGFLLMDSCYKMTDKYLLAMTFVYFKRARLSIDEYTRKNLFIALYLANTMEEDEEENKYEIFPWALGKNWRKQFPRFIKMRDKLWARMDHRAAVSRRCCEEVMAIVPSHYLWQRNRSEHHGYAQRQYSDQSLVPFPRGPSASPVFCALCKRGTSLDKGSTAQTQNPAFHRPLISAKQVEITPPRKLTPCWRKIRAKPQTEHSACCCVEEPSSDESACCSSYDASMEWINEE
ncbi:speedy protein A [Cheilinus undulatus]|uniref:speedy protein A n=1 Tax=Cheilinus undulatus TaxID=241271 RepID=UPI001BD4A01B|nr:speedy protein A [Cheilinus undulatus]